MIRNAEEPPTGHGAPEVSVWSGGCRSTSRSYALVGRSTTRASFCRSHGRSPRISGKAAVVSRDWAAGDAAKFEGDKPGAVRAYKAALEFFQIVDDKTYLSTISAELAYALLDVGDLDGALGARWFESSHCIRG